MGVLAETATRVANTHPELCLTCDIRRLAPAGVRCALDVVRDMREAMVVGSADEAARIAIQSPAEMQDPHVASAAAGCLQRHQTDQCVRLL